MQKIKQILEFLKNNSSTTRDWAVAIASCVGVITVIIGVRRFNLEREKEALARYQRVMRDLGDESDTVRAAAAVAMSALMEKDYGKYGQASIPVLLNQLTTEQCPPVRDKIWSIVFEKREKINDIIEPLTWVIRGLTAELSESQYESFINGGPIDVKLLGMSRELVSFLNKKIPTELDLSGVFIINWSFQDPNLEGQDFRKVHLVSCSLNKANLKEANLERAKLFRVDLTGAYLQNANLSYAFFREVVLKDAELSDATIEGADLASIDLSQSNLTGAKLTRTILFGSDMRGAILRNADLLSAHLTEADLTEANLTGADLKGAFLERAILDGTELGEANLISAGLMSASLKNAVLTNAHLESANFESANFENANLENASLNGANLIGANFTGANLAEASLAEANLTGADLKGAHLERANLKYTELVNANLSGANLTGADFETATLEGSNLADANLADANLKGVNLDGTILDRVNLDGADLRAAVIFSINSEFQSGLDKGAISEDLHQEFMNKGFYLPQSTTFSVDKIGQKWLINDKENRKEYIIRKEKENLNIYNDTKFDLESIKKAKNWEGAIYDNDIRQRLSISKN